MNKLHDPAYWRERLMMYLRGRCELARALVIPNRDAFEGRGAFKYEYSCFEDWILRHGKNYAPHRLPRAYREREVGRCYSQALTLAEENPRTLLYCEGFAMLGNGSLPVEHAWNIEKKSRRVVDVTWNHGDRNEPQNPKAYRGVILPLDLVRAINNQPDRSYWGLIVDDCWNGYPLLRARFSIKRARAILKELQEKQSG